MARKSGSAGGSLVKAPWVRWAFDKSGRYEYIVYIGLDTRSAVPMVYLYRLEPLPLGCPISARTWTGGSLVIVNVLQL